MLSAKLFLWPARCLLLLILSFSVYGGDPQPSGGASSNEGSEGKVGSVNEANSEVPEFVSQAGDIEASSDKSSLDKSTIDEKIYYQGQVAFTDETRAIRTVKLFLHERALQDEQSSTESTKWTFEDIDTIPDTVRNQLDTRSVNIFQKGALDSKDITMSVGSDGDPEPIDVDNDFMGVFESVINTQHNPEASVAVKREYTVLFTSNLPPGVFLNGEGYRHVVSCMPGDNKVLVKTFLDDVLVRSIIARILEEDQSTLEISYTEDKLVWSFWLTRYSAMWDSASDDASDEFSFLNERTESHSELAESGDDSALHDALYKQRRNTEKNPRYTITSSDSGNDVSDVLELDEVTDKPESPLPMTRRTSVTDLSATNAFVTAKTRLAGVGGSSSISSDSEVEPAAETGDIKTSPFRVIDDEGSEPFSSYSGEVTFIDEGADQNERTVRLLSIRKRQVTERGITFSSHWQFDDQEDVPENVRILLDQREVFLSEADTQKAEASVSENTLPPGSEVSIDDLLDASDPIELIMTSGVEGAQERISDKNNIMIIFEELLLQNQLGQQEIVMSEEFGRLYAPQLPPDVILNGEGYKHSVVYDIEENNFRVNTFNTQGLIRTLIIKVYEEDDSLLEISYSENGIRWTFRTGRYERYESSDLSSSDSFHGDSDLEVAELFNSLSVAPSPSRSASADATHKNDTLGEDDHPLAATMPGEPALLVDILNPPVVIPGSAGVQSFLQ